jgi:integrase
MPTASMIAAGGNRPQDFLLTRPKRPRVPQVLGSEPPDGMNDTHRINCHTMRRTRPTIRHFAKEQPWCRHVRYLLGHSNTTTTAALYRQSRVRLPLMFDSGPRLRAPWCRTH